VDTSLIIDSDKYWIGFRVIENPVISILRSKNRVDYGF